MSDRPNARATLWRPRGTPDTFETMISLLAAVGRTYARTARPVALLIALTACGSPANEPPSLAAQELRYDREYPAIPYSSATPTDRVARLAHDVTTGRAELVFEPGRGYLAALLEALDIPVSSQMLVFTRTSLQAELIAPETPRAIYFNDDAYVAWVPDADQLEIAAMDPDLGPVFYTLDQTADRAPAFERKTEACLECHDSYSLTGGGVPRFLIGSGLPDRAGDPVYHEGWFLTTDRTPLRLRWGGWYVTGTHGSQTHMGNVAVAQPSDVADLDFRATGNLIDLSTLIDPEPYLTDHSDIVALLVAEHQIHVQNTMVRVSWDARMALAKDAETDPARDDDESLTEAIAEITEPLVRALLLVEEAPLEAPVRGTSGFARWFEGLGPLDPEGRSLRQLDLRTRLFRYPLSYQVYASAFDELPIPVREQVYRRLHEILTGADAGAAFKHLSVADREAILDILEATRPEIRQWRARQVR